MRYTTTDELEHFSLQKPTLLTCSWQADFSI